MRGRRAFLGIDLSTTTDLSAIAILMPDGDNYDLTCEFFCPADRLGERSRRDRVPYELWRNQGYLTATPGSVIDYAIIEERIHALMREFDVAEVCIDPWNAKALTTKLLADGVPVVEVGQTMANLSGASKEFETLVLSRRIRHDSNPVLRWNVTNAVIDTDANGNMKPSKKRSRERIDGATATITALARAMVQPAEPESVYQHRGVVVV